jgi:hypothetical protein
MSKIRKSCNKEYLEDIIEQIFVWFFVVGAFALIAIIPVSLFIGEPAATICIAIWVALWGVSFVVFLAWPYIRWMTAKVYDVINNS